MPLSIAHKLLILLDPGGIPGPALTSPANAALTGDLTPTLDWETVIGATTYEVQIANDSTFTDLIDSDTGIAATEYTPSSDLDIDAKTIYWRVRVDAPGTGAWSETRSLIYDLDLLAVALGGVLFYPTNETEGTTADNLGTLGATGDMTLANMLALGASIGSNSAFEFDGTTSVGTITANAAFNNLIAFTKMFLINPDGPGQNSAGHFWSDTGARRICRINGINMDLNAFVDTDTTDAQSTTNNAFIAADTNYALFFSYDNAGDRKIYIDKFTSGVLTAAAYSAQTAGTGNLTNGSGNVTVGDRPAGNRKYDGHMGKIAVFPASLTTLRKKALGLASDL